MARRALLSTASAVVSFLKAMYPSIDRLIDRGRQDHLQAAIANKPGKLGEPRPILQAPPQLLPLRIQWLAARRPTVVLLKPEQRGLGVRLVVRQRLPGGTACA